MQSEKKLFEVTLKRLGPQYGNLTGGVGVKNYPGMDWWPRLQGFSDPPKARYKPRLNTDASAGELEAGDVIVIERSRPNELLPPLRLHCHLEIADHSPNPRKNSNASPRFYIRGLHMFHVGNDDTGGLRVRYRQQQAT